MSQIYRVRGIDLDHDGTRYPEGAEIELDDKAAADLQRFLEPPKGEAVPTPAEKAAIEMSSAEVAEQTVKLAEPLPKKSSAKGAK
jgi:hypothetical protein